MVLLINRLIFRDPVSARNWLGVIFSTLGVMILLFQGNPLHATSLHTFSVGDLWGHGVGAELGALLLAITSEGPPDPGEWLCRRQLAARRPDPAAHRHLLADAPPGAGLGRLARAVFPQRPGVSGDFPVVAGLSVLEQRYRRDWRHPGEIYTHIIPLSGGVLSILFLHTQPHAWHLFSALFIMVGIGICSLEKRQAAAIRLRG